MNTPRPHQSPTPYPWSFRNSAQNRDYTSRPQIVTPRPSHLNRSFTPSQPSWVEDRFINNPVDRNEEFDLVDFQSLPESYRTAFMTVEDLLKNKGMISPPGPNSQNVVVVFDEETTHILNPDIESLVTGLLPTLVPGSWRSMTFIQGCCPVLRYHAANDTLVNINGQEKKIVHFSKYNPPMYQFIPHGLCAQREYSANGHCLQGTVTMSLLVYDLRLNPPLSFDIFSIPSYCNCVQF